MKRIAKILILSLVCVCCAVGFAACEEKKDDITPDEYFTFTLLDDDSYEISAKKTDNMPANMVLPSTRNGKAVTSIGISAFVHCSNLTSITIPDSVKIIWDAAFVHCSNLTSITIGNGVTSIGDGAFYNCSSLTSITIGNSVTSIGDYTFSRCGSLTSVTIPDSVTSIGGIAFSDCRSLTSITIGNRVKSIGESALSGCINLTSITFNGTKAQWQAISKGWIWKSGVPATIVHCTDGDVNI